jgi:hypothetical protein
MVNKKLHHNKIMWASIGTGNIQFTSLEKTGETGKDIKTLCAFSSLPSSAGTTLRKLRNGVKKIEKKYIPVTHLLEEIVSVNPSIFLVIPKELRTA